MVIPSYWQRESHVGWMEKDTIFDHPTPLDNEGTLPRAIQSVGILEDKDFQLVIIAVPTSEDIQAEVEKKISGIIESVCDTAGVEILLFGPSHLKQIHELLTNAGKKDYIDLLQLNGYSNIRNLCMFIPHILDSEAAVLIDDDEVFEDSKFIFKAKEFINKNHGDKKIYAVAGYYLQPDGDYHVDKPYHHWMKYWDQYENMNNAFDQVIGTEPRLKKTPFVFGGNMVIHRKLFTVVPFDPDVPRGEDIDYLINARMFGFHFFLDNQLSIKHLPPSKSHPTWKGLREDIYRFVYERSKIENQEDVEGMKKVYPEDFDPYPGCFLKDDLNEKIEGSSKLLSEEYLAQGNIEDSKEAFNNITLAKTDAIPGSDPFQKLCKLQKRWQEMMDYTAREEIRLRIRDIIMNKGAQHK